MPKPLRLISKKWDTYQSDGFTYPIQMKATYPEFSWKKREVYPSDSRNEYPLFWFPEQAARSLDIDLETYLTNYCLVPPRQGNRPVRRPKAVMYLPMYDLIEQKMTNYIMQQALNPIKTLLQANDIWAGQAYCWPYNVFGAGEITEPDFHSPAWNTAYPTLLGITFPVTGYQEIDDGDGFIDLHKTYIADSAEGGEILYIIADRLINVVPLAKEVAVDEHEIREPAFNHQVELIKNLGNNHDKCLFFSALGGLIVDGDFAEYDFAINTILPQYKAASEGYFDYHFYTDELWGSETNQGILAEIIKDKILEFFEL